MVTLLDTNVVSELIQRSPEPAVRGLDLGVGRRRETLLVEIETPLHRHAQGV